MSLVRQSYGIAMAQNAFGGPRGVWLECRTCARSDRIKGASTSMPDAVAAKEFRAGGWTGYGQRMSNAHCPDCNKERKRKRQKEYTKRASARRAGYFAAYYRAHKARISMRRKQYRINNRERYNAIRRQWWKRHRAEIKVAKVLGVSIPRAREMLHAVPR